MQMQRYTKEHSKKFHQEADLGVAADAKKEQPITGLRTML